MTKATNYDKMMKEFLTGVKSRLDDTSQSDILHGYTKS
jgi:hypothetical protein